MHKMNKKPSNVILIGWYVEGVKDTSTRPLTRSIHRHSKRQPKASAIEANGMLKNWKEWR